MGMHHRSREIRQTARSYQSLGLIAISTSIGVLLVATAYTSGRLGYASAPWADWIYWFGQAFIVIPIATLMVVRRFPTEIEAVTPVLILTIAEYLVKVCYSPAAFTYSDELSHWRTATDILNTGKLFSVNYNMPISPRYPGLEEITTALVKITGMPLFVCGLIVASISHVTFIGILYLLFRYIAGSARIAGIAALLYFSSPDLPYFDSLFAYQTLALPFFALALLAVWHIISDKTSGSTIGWLTVALATIAATVVTHHVTSLMLIGTLFLVAFTCLIVGDHRGLLWIEPLAVASAILTACWIILIAPQTVSYLQPAVGDVAQSTSAMLHGGHSSGPSIAAAPFSNRILGAAAVIVFSILIPFGIWRVWREYRRQPWIVAMAIASLSWYLVVVIRLKVSDGSELAGRAGTFAYIPIAFIVALIFPYVEARVSRYRVAVSCCSIGIVLILLFNSLVNSWPPYWERLPGSYQVAGFERSVTPENVDAAIWSLTALGPGNRFAADFGNTQLLGSYGNQSMVLGVSFLYNSPIVRKSDRIQVQALSISDVLVDLRLSRQLPATGAYFPIDPNGGHYSRPLPLSDLTKFNNVPGISRIYDSGNIVIYSLKGSRYYDP